MQKGKIQARQRLKEVKALDRINPSISGSYTLTHTGSAFMQTALKKQQFKNVVCNNAIKEPSVYTFSKPRVSTIIKQNYCKRFSKN